MVIQKHDEIRLPLLTALVAGMTLVASATAAGRESTESLLDLAKRKFGAKNLTVAETELFRATQAGERAWGNCGGNLDNASNWSDECTVQAERLAWLCTDPKASALVTYRGIEPWGMKIKGYLNLAGAEIKFPFDARNSVFTGTIQLQGAQLRALYLLGCRIKSLNGSRAKIAGAVYLRENFKAEGEIELAGATIGGYLDCSGAQLSNPNKAALTADRAIITGSVFLCEQVDEEGNVISHFRSNGELRLPGASIGGNLDCEGAQFSNPNKTARNANDVKYRQENGRLDLQIQRH